MRRRGAGDGFKVTLFGNFGTGNLGNDASLHAAIVQLRRVRPAAQLTVACPAPDVVRAEYDVETTTLVPAALLLRGAPRALRLLAKPIIELGRWAAVAGRIGRSDVVLVPGTGILDDFWEIPSGMPYRIFGWTLVARVARRPFELVSIGAGPINDPRSKRLFRAAARLSTNCSYRDNWSRDYMRALGHDVSNDPVTPDLVLSLPRRSDDGPASPRRPCIAIGVMDYRGWNAQSDGERILTGYLDKLATYASAMLDEGYDIKVIEGAVEDTSAIDVFVAMMAERRPEARSQGTVRFHRHHTFAELLDDLAEVDVLVATRYHNVMAALMTGTPVISIGYAAKNTELMKLFELEAYCHHVEEFEVDGLISSTRLLRERGPFVSSGMFAVIDKLAAETADQFEEIVARCG
jgi:polysaccharide pyruvyl transferase WcaK-like protein